MGKINLQTLSDYEAIEQLNLLAENNNKKEFFEYLKDVLPLFKIQNNFVSEAKDYSFNLVFNKSLISEAINLIASNENYNYLIHALDYNGENALFNVYSNEVVDIAYEEVYDDSSFYEEREELYHNFKSKIYLFLYLNLDINHKDNFNNTFYMRDMKLIKEWLPEFFNEMKKRGF